MINQKLFLNKIAGTEIRQFVNGKWSGIFSHDTIWIIFGFGVLYSYSQHFLKSQKLYSRWWKTPPRECVFILLNIALKSSIVLVLKTFTEIKSQKCTSLRIISEQYIKTMFNKFLNSFKIAFNLWFYIWITSICVRLSV